MSAAAPRFRVVAVERREWPFRLRLPFRFGVVTVTHGRQAVLRARVTEEVRPGGVFAPLHWTGEEASHGRVGGLIPPANEPGLRPARAEGLACPPHPLPPRMDRLRPGAPRARLGGGPAGARRLVG